MGVLSLKGYSSREVNSIFRVMANLMYSFLYAGAFWYAVFYLTKERKGASLGLCIEMLGPLYFGVVMSSAGDVSGGYASYFWIRMGMQILALGSFGWTYFKKPVGLWLIFVYIAMSGITASNGSFQLFIFMDDFFRNIGMDNFLEFRIPIGERSYESVFLLRYFVDALKLLLKVILFWGIFYGIKEDSRFDFSMRTVSVFPKLDKFTISIVYWTFRLILISMTFGLVRYFTYARPGGFEVRFAFELFFMSIAIFVVGSFFRNFLTAWFASKGKYPNGLYFFLNVPIINFFVWLKLLFSPDTPVKLSLRSSGEMVDKEGYEYEEEEVFGSVQEAEALQGQFVREGRNRPIKTGMILLLVLISIFRIGAMFDRVNENGLMILLGSAFISLMLAIWYMNDKKAVFILFALEFVTALLAPIIDIDGVTNFVSFAGLVSLVIYYVLFHFEEFRFVDDGDG